MLRRNRFNNNNTFLCYCDKGIGLLRWCTLFVLYFVRFEYSKVLHKVFFLEYAHEGFCITFTSKAIFTLMHRNWLWLIILTSTVIWHFRLSPKSNTLLFSSPRLTIFCPHNANQPFSVIIISPVSTTYFTFIVTQINHFLLLLSPDLIIHHYNQNQPLSIITIL